MVQLVEARKSWVRFQMESLRFFIDLILPVDSASNRNQYPG